MFVGMTSIVLLAVAVWLSSGAAGPYCDGSPAVRFADWIGSSLTVCAAVLVGWAAHTDANVDAAASTFLCRNAVSHVMAPVSSSRVQQRS